MNDILETSDFGTSKRPKAKEAPKKEKSPSRFFDGLTMLICVVAILGAAGYGFRMALATLSVVGRVWSWGLTVIAMYLILYTIYKLRYLVK